MSNHKTLQINPKINPNWCYVNFGYIFQMHHHSGWWYPNFMKSDGFKAQTLTFPPVAILTSEDPNISWQDNNCATRRMLLVQVNWHNRQNRRFSVIASQIFFFIGFAVWKSIHLNIFCAHLGEIHSWHCDFHDVWKRQRRDSNPRPSGSEGVS